MDSLTVLALGALALYLLACWWWPYAACGRCKGAGRHRSPTGKAFRQCRRCKGSGRRVRLGRRLFEAARGKS